MVAKIIDLLDKYISRDPASADPKFINENRQLYTADAITWKQQESYGEKVLAQHQRRVGHPKSEDGVDLYNGNSSAASSTN